MKLLKQIFSSYYMNKSGYLPYYKKNINSINNKNIRKCLHTACKTLFLQRSNEVALAGYQRIDDIVQKFKMCDDKVIKKEAARHILNTLKNDSDLNTVAYSQAEKLLDCANTAVGKYSILSKYYPYNTSGYIKEKTLDDEDWIFKYNQKPEIRKIFNCVKQRQKNINLNELYEKCKLNCIKDYITDLNFDNNAGEYLWKKYFLAIPYVTSDIKESLEKINKEFGVKIFFDEMLHFPKMVINYILDEFRIWKDAGKNKVKYPKLLDITQYAENFILNDNIVADTNNFYKRIRINSENNVYNSIRHEMVHINDRDSYADKISKIIIPSNRKEEMRKAGISKELIDYAQTNAREFRAVFGEGNMRMYSADFKQEMINRGLPEYVTKLKSHSEYKSELLKEIFKDNWQRNVLIRLYNYFSNDIPSEIIQKLISGKIELEFLDKWLKNK